MSNTDTTSRPWFKKKRFMIPIGLFALFVIIGAFAPPAEEDEPEAAVPTTAPVVAEAPAPESPAEAPVAEAPPVTEAPTTTAPPAPPTTKAPAESVSQKNAKRSADDYLDFQAFSRTGLINQLEFEGFSTEDATYGVDSLGADWNEQAAKKAAEYLDFQSFSRSGLVNQLQFEGFSPTEAEYGVSTTGL